MLIISKFYADNEFLFRNYSIPKLTLKLQEIFKYSSQYDQRANDIMNATGTNQIRVYITLTDEKLFIFNILFFFSKSNED